jgi:hypothetical protein
MGCVIRQSTYRKTNNIEVLTESVDSVEIPTKHKSHIHEEIKLDTSCTFLIQSCRVSTISTIETGRTSDRELQDIIP